MRRCGRESILAGIGLLCLDIAVALVIVARDIVEQMGRRVYGIATAAAHDWRVAQREKSPSQAAPVVAPSADMGHHP